MTEFLLCFVLFSYIIVLLYKFVKYGHNLILRLASWFMLFYFFYFLYPALCLDSFSKSDKFFFDSELISKTKLLVSFLGLIFLVFFSQLRFPTMETLTIGKPSKILFYLSIVVAVLAFFILIKSLKELISVYRSFGTSFKYGTYRSTLEKIRAKAHLKILIYSLLAVFYFYCLPARHLRGLVVADLLLAVVFDFISGTRTSMFLIVLFLYILLVRLKNRMYIVPMAVIASLVLFSSDFVRSIGLNYAENHMSFFEKLLLGNGEFNNTLVTLPFVLNGDIGKNFSVVTVLNWANFIPPLIKIIDEPLLGTIFQNHINRGIGYASNIISNWYFIAGIWSILIITFFFIAFIWFDEKLVSGEFYLIKILMICFLRNFFREGIASFMSFSYIFCVYFGLFILLNKKNRRLLCIKFRH